MLRLRGRRLAAAHRDALSIESLLIREASVGPIATVSFVRVPAFPRRTDPFTFESDCILKCRPSAGCVPANREYPLELREMMRSARSSMGPILAMAEGKGGSVRGRTVGSLRKPQDDMTTSVIGNPQAQTRRDASIGGPSDTRSAHETSREQRRYPNVDEVLDDSFPASDPPSWTGAISRVAPTSNVNGSITRRIRAEFIEMPGLCLTAAQAQRLWCLEPPMCEALLNSLVAARVLRRTHRGLFVLRSPHN